MPDRSGPLDIKLAGLPFKVMQTPGARPGAPAKAEYVCKEVEQIRDHFGGGNEPNYGDYPTSVESVYFQDDWSNGLSPTRLQKIDKTYWQAQSLDARRPGQIIGGPASQTANGAFSATPSGPVVRIMDWGTAAVGPYIAAGKAIYRFNGVSTFNPVYTFGGGGPAAVLVTDLAAFNGNLLAAAKGTTSDSGSGGTVTYGASTLTDTAKAWTVNAWAGRLVFAGGQINVVLSNTATVLTMLYPWSATPGAGTAYSIDPYCAYVWSPDGTTWNTVDPRGGGVDAAKADKFAAVRFQLWKSVLPNKVYSCLDPTAVVTAAASWTSTPSLIGDSTKNITSLSAYTTDLAIGKEDGLWSLDRNGNDFPILPDLAAVASATNCANMRQWQNGLRFPVRNSFYSYEGSKLESIGLDRYRAKSFQNTPVILTPVDSAPYLNELFVAFVSGADSYIASLLPNPWRWHIWAYLSGRIITAMAVTTTFVGAGSAAGQPMLFVASQTAGVPQANQWFRLPTNTDNPLDDPNYVYPASSLLQTTEIAPLPDQDKTFTLLRLKVAMSASTLVETVAVSYAADNDIDLGVWTPMVGPQKQATQKLNQLTGGAGIMEWYFPKPTVAKSIQFQVVFTYVSGNGTFILRHVVLHYKHMPQPRRRWEIGLLCESGALGQDSYRDERSGEAQVQELLQLRQQPRVPRPFEDRMGRVWEVFIERIDHELLEKLPGQGDRWLCKVTLLENVGTMTPALAPLEAV